jgi:hypothetical protein
MTDLMQLVLTTPAARTDVAEATLNHTDAELAPWVP